jgi:DNA-binding Xre family transcriptional regulator
MSEEDYLDLLDNAEAKDVKNRIENGEETWPHDVVRALISGTEPVRVFRQHRGMTMADLAEKTGLSQPYISEIETGKKQGSLKALHAICAALHISLDDLAGYNTQN